MCTMHVSCFSDNTVLRISVCDKQFMQLFSHAPRRSLSIYDSSCLGRSISSKHPSLNYHTTCHTSKHPDKVCTDNIYVTIPWGAHLIDYCMPTTAPWQSDKKTRNDLWRPLSPGLHEPPSPARPSVWRAMRNRRFYLSVFYC